MKGDYMTVKKYVESLILSGITVRIYNKRRANKYYRSSEYVMERARIRKEKEEKENEQHPETNE